ncbi:TlpA family protein disulfide reductase [Halobaculum sp. MBLA0143]|uniref:TlpA family protein disulfide reductase n=1 Tax=Halobaculum sp. MBLA0143 TaxID=3079933 RepID=UPI0035260BB6
MKRRAYLAAVGTAASAGLAGCVGVDGPDADGGPDDRGPAGDGSTAGSDATPTGTDRGLVLPTVSAPGSPSGTVGLSPPDRAVLVDFFATWCAPCKPEMDNLRRVRERFDETALAVVSVTQESDEAAIRSFWRRHDGTWPVARDPELAATQAYDVTGIPTVVVQTPSGETTLRHTGLAGTDRLVAGVERALQS